MTTHLHHRFALGLTTLATLVACEQPIEGFAGSGGGGSGGSGGASSTAEAASVTTTNGATTATTSTSGSTGTGEPPVLPFAVDDHFEPGGYMGDGANPGLLTDLPNCPVRAGDEAGTCHRFTYSKGNVGWAGVYWQHPSGNWGSSPGLSVPADPVRITFWAWADSGSPTVTFLAGGLGTANTPYKDTFKVEKAIALTTTPTEYVLEIGDAPHTEILGGFGWAAAAPSGGTLTFHIDDIRYRTSP